MHAYPTAQSNTRMRRTRSEPVQCSSVLSRFGSNLRVASAARAVITRARRAMMMLAYSPMMASGESQIQVSRYLDEVSYN